MDNSADDDAPALGIECPLCFDVVTRAFPIPLASSSLADVFAMSPETLRQSQLDAQAKRVEGELRAHLEKHGPREWLPALMEARRELIACQTALAAQTRETLGMLP